ncbi:DUF427-domain-containing protein [Hypoxylon sp. FL1857]|nr:DUF427-domain-containing protein [Hypoxylon sp. FL1857]
MPSPHTQQNLDELGQRLVEKGPVKTLPTSRRVRILFNGEYIVDTTSALYVWEHEYYPYYYVPRESVAGSLDHPPIKPDSFCVATLHVGRKTTDRIIVFGNKLAAQSKALQDMVRFEFGAADAWFEEDTPIYVHPKDPFRRVDVLHSSRPLEVRVGGVVVARTNSAFHLHETGLPCRYYVPATAVDHRILRDSETTTACPYKGVANYYDVEVGDDDAARQTTVKDLVWYYKTPTLECANIAGFLCFYHEKEGVEITLDGAVVPRPKTPWS